MRRRNSAGDPRHPAAGRAAALVAVLAVAPLLGGPARGLVAEKDARRGAEPAPKPKPEVPRERHIGSSGPDLVEVVRRIRERMGRSAERLGRHELGDPLRRDQAEAVRLLEELFQAVAAMQRSSSSSSSSRPSPSRGSKQEQEDQARGRKRRPAERREGRKPLRDRPQDGNQRTRNDGVAEGRLEPARVQGPLEARTGSGRWGNLPGSVIEDMLQSGRDGIPMKYAEIISRYYRRLSEIGEPRR